MVAQVQNLGLAHITEALHAYTTRAKYLQWGVGSGQAVTDTDLDSKTTTTEARTNGTSSQQTTNTTNDTYRVTGTITALGSRAITELGVFNGAGSSTPPTGDTMVFYTDFSVINLSTSDFIQFQVDVVFDQG